MKNKRALIVVDVQNDFCPGGALAVANGDRIIPVINGIMHKFEIVIATQDWHPQGQVSFASNHAGKNIYDQVDINGIAQTLWPDHCVQGTTGADFHKDLDTTRFNSIMRKGVDPEIDSYSAFLENDKKTETGLHGYIKALKIREVFVCGLATDYCVYFTAMDAAHYGFRTSVVLDASAGIDVPEGNIKACIANMRKKKINILNSNEL